MRTQIHSSRQWRELELAPADEPEIAVAVGDHRRVEDIGETLNLIERELIRIIREGRSETRSREEVNRELITLARQLHAVFHRLQHRLERRDLSFDQERALRDFLERCLWLYRKAKVEDFFLRELRLEAQLRSRVPPDVFEIYETLQTLQREEEHFSGLDNEALHRFLSETSLDAEEPLEAPEPPEEGVALNSHV
jgi:hypothetical protein